MARSPHPCDERTELLTSVEAAADALWTAYETGGEIPIEIFAPLDHRQGQAVQAEILARRLARGDQQVGWKVGLTSERARTAVGIDARPFGHLMHLVDSGATIPADAAAGASIEAELCFTAGERISGPDLSAADVRERLATVAAGYELNERRAVVGGDIAALIADNLTNWAIVEGEGAPVADVDDIDATVVAVHCDGTERFRCVSRDEVDNPYESIARLAQTLHEHGLAIEPGQRIITGAYCRFDVAPGQTWSADYSGLGRVEITYT